MNTRSIFSIKEFPFLTQKRVLTEKLLFDAFAISKALLNLLSRVFLTPFTTSVRSNKGCDISLQICLTKLSALYFVC